MLKNRYFYEDNNCASGFMVDLAMGYWGRRQCAFFDIRVFHPNAQSYRNTSIPSVYRRHEQQKKREYGDRVREVELASFTPLVFSTTGGMGKEAVTFYRRLAELLSHDLQQHSCVASLFVVLFGGDYSTERNDGLNYGTERFLKLKLATYHC